ncbi:hypothetical protein ACFL6N_03415 [Thermodesulfobacteriota bacterium]
MEKISFRSKGIIEIILTLILLALSAFTYYQDQEIEDLTLEYNNKITIIEQRINKINVTDYGDKIENLEQRINKINVTDYGDKIENLEQRINKINTENITIIKESKGDLNPVYLNN